jgi:hypothetical protein
MIKAVLHWVKGIFKTAIRIEDDTNDKFNG